MNSSSLKLSLGIFILLVYVSIGVFGLLQFGHMNEKPMVNCPYAPNSYAICANGFAHINNWRQFSNIILPSLLLFSFLIFGIILHFFNKQNFLNPKLYFYKWKYYLDNKKSYSYTSRIIKWLSLFENSPSFVYVRHS